MKVAVLGGGGAMGGVFGAHLAQAGNDVTLIDVSQAALDAINSRGLCIADKEGNARTVEVRATSHPSDVGPVDLIINFVKCYHTEAAIRSVEPMLSDDTAVLSLQNGWGNAPRIAKIVGEERVLVGVSYHSATLLEPGKVLHAGKGKTFIGELSGEATERSTEIAKAFESAGLDISVSNSVMEEIWSKLALNVCTLPTAALLRFEAQQLIEHDGTLELMRALLHEVIAVAQAQDIALDYDERWQAITGLLERAIAAKASMLQDVERSRRTEIDVINGAVVEAGRRLDIPTPHNDTMVWLVKSLEATFVRS